MIVENLLIILLFLAMAEQSRDEYLPWPHLLLRTLSRLEVNPLIIALMAGVAVSLSGIGLAVIFIKTVNLLALSSSALTLFFIGGKLVTTVSSFFSLSLLLWGLGHLL
jgi:malonate transporter